MDVAGSVPLLVQSVDCSKYSEQNTSEECDDRADIGMGVLLVAALVVAVLAWVAWRLLLRRSRRRASSDVA